MVEVLECPCENFTAISKILDYLLDTQDGVSKLLDWLDGKSDQQALLENKILSCGKRSRCRFRYGTSVAILNAIRDACRPHLEIDSLVTKSGMKNVAELSFSSGNNSPFEQEFPKAQNGANYDENTTYEEAFPSLNASSDGPKQQHPAASNILVVPGGAKSQNKETKENVLVQRKKPKRRIRPQLTTLPPAGTRNVWGSADNKDVPSRQVPMTTGNLSHLPSQQPLDLPVKTRKVELTSELPRIVPTTPTKQMTDSQTRNEGPNQDPAVEKPRISSVSLDNLIRVYTHLFRNLLIPSTALELHFLLRLIALQSQQESLPPRPQTADEAPSQEFFRPLFRTSDCCRKFACQALVALWPTLRSIPPVILSKIVECEPLKSNCEPFRDRLQTQLEEWKRQGVNFDNDTELVTGAHAILTLPFDQERDSRHNYKTQMEITAYKNREESRDAFLYELRAFMSTKGKVLRPQEIERAQDRVRREARSILDKLLSVNMMWFAEFFCELLLQVGLAPVQETDQELLSITNKEKLQKLHKRFSSRSSHTSKSSKKIALQQSSKSKAQSPKEEARTLFLGYQEFFVLFLDTLPFNFGFHLRSHMAKKIAKLADETNRTMLERHLLQMRLAARFLGYLIFSPNWHETGVDLNKMQAVTGSDGIQQLEGLGLSLLSRVNDAYDSGTILLTLPWVVEVLRMSKWDSISQTSKSFRQILANLRHIQASIVWTEETSPMVSTTTGIIFSFMEQFFHECCTFSRLTALPASNMERSTPLPSDCIDQSAVSITTVMCFAADPHFEDVVCLLEDMQRGLIAKSPVKARKLRPHTVSKETTMEPTRLFGDTMSDRTSTISTHHKSKSLSTSLNDNQSIETKLREAFFHQHRDLKEVCDFVIARVLKTTATTIVREKTIEAVRNLGKDEHLDAISFDKVVASTVQSASNELESEFETAISTILGSLAPKNLRDKVKDIAVTLAVSSGMKSANSILKNMAINELDSVNTSIESENKKKEKNASKSKDLSQSDALVAATEAIVHLIKSMKDFIVDGSLGGASITSRIIDVKKVLNIAKREFETSVSSEEGLRGLFMAIVSLRQIQGPFLDCLTQTSEGEADFAPVSSFYMLLVDVSFFSRPIPLPANVLIDTKRLTTLLKCFRFESNDCESLQTMLRKLIRTRLLGRREVAECLQQKELSERERNILQQAAG